MSWSVGAAYQSIRPLVKKIQSTHSKLNKCSVVVFINVCEAFISHCDMLYGHKDRNYSRK